MPFGSCTVFSYMLFSFGLLLISFDSGILPDEDVYQMPNRSGFVSVFPPVPGSPSLSHTVLCRHVTAIIQAHTQHNPPALALTTWNILDKCFYCRNPCTDTPNLHHNKQLCSSKHSAPVWSDHRGGQCFSISLPMCKLFKWRLSRIQIRA